MSQQLANYNKSNETSFDSTVIGSDIAIDEKAIQKYGQYLMECFGQGQGMPCYILEEDITKSNDNILQEDLWIIKNDLIKKDSKTYGIRGLVSSIEVISSGIFKDFREKNPRIIKTDRELATICADHFIKIFNQKQSKSNIISLIFDQKEGSFGELQRKTFVDGVELSYLVYSFEDFNKVSKTNAFYHIKEKRFHDINCNGTRSDRFQKPDFVTYVNGIPFILHEYKTLKTGLIQACKDMRDKQSYQKLPFVFVTDGQDAALLSDPFQINLTDKDANIPLYSWTNYKNKPILGQDGERPQSGFENILDVLFSNYENMCLYFQHAVFVDHITDSEDNKTDKKPSRTVIKLARVQQFSALLAFKNELCTSLQKKERPIVNFGVLHTQRTGKTLTMRMMVHLLFNNHEDFYKKLFSKIFLYAPDLTILNVICDEFKKDKGNTFNINIIEKQKEYKEVISGIHKESSQRAVYILNMQKISQKEMGEINQKHSKNKQTGGSGILNIIDEGHVSQTGNLAYARDVYFPNSSNVIFTATPKPSTFESYLKKGKGVILDVFNYSQAVGADIIVPVVFHKAQKNMALDIENRAAGNSSDKEKEIASLLKNIESAVIDDIVEKQKEIGDGDKNIDDLRKDAEEISKNMSYSYATKSAIWERLNEECMEAKISYMVDFQTKVINSLTDEKGPSFAPKAICYCKDKFSAKQIILFIQEKNITNSDFLYLNDDERQKAIALRSEWLKETDPSLKEELRGRLLALANKKGQMNDVVSSSGHVWRFAIDYSGLDDVGDNEDSSDNKKDDKTDDAQNTTTKTKIQSEQLNGAHLSPFNISGWFKKGERSDSGQFIDILIVVDKYTKGFDLPNLTTVFLNKNISEISLMNQIFTRPATKMHGKSSGYCVDLMFGETNYDSFMQSMRIYNNETDQQALVFDDEKAQKIVGEIRGEIEKLCVLMGIKDPSMITHESVGKWLGAAQKDGICNDTTLRHMEFAKIGKGIFNHITTLRAVLYLAEEKRILSVIYDTFKSLRDQYASKTARYSGVEAAFDIKKASSKDAQEILIDRAAIKQLIDDVLGSIKDGSGLSSILNLRYEDLRGLPQEKIDAEKKLLSQAAENRRSNNRFTLLVSVSEVGRRVHSKNLSERLHAFIERVQTYPEGLYTKEANEEIRILLEEHEKEKKERIKIIVETQGSVLAYFIKDGLTKFADEHFPGQTQKCRNDIIKLFSDVAQKTDRFLIHQLNGQNVSATEMTGYYQGNLNDKMTPSLYATMTDLLEKNVISGANITPYAAMIKESGEYHGVLLRVVTEAIWEKEALCMNHSIKESRLE